MLQALPNTNTSIRFLRPRETARLLGVSLTTIWRLARQADFPKPYRVGRQAIGYSQAELIEWLNARRLA